MDKRLSILTVTLESRSQIFHNLAKALKSQANSSVEMLANCDNGEKSIGQKRNELLQAARGDYVVFVDDDDMVSPFYIYGILKAIESNPDCCGIEGIITLQNVGPKKFIHSLQYNEWFKRDGIYYRCPNHLNPIKREIAIEAGFPEKSWQEDQDFSYRLKGKLKTEVYIKGPIYFYYPNHVSC
jgi:cellulose synthase/poly-beta-1,6-N-acetylglucosamine synthase-like glycosyltransferase